MPACTASVTTSATETCASSSGIMPASIRLSSSRSPTSLVIRSALREMTSRKRAVVGDSWSSSLISSAYETIEVNGERSS